MIEEQEKKELNVIEIEKKFKEEEDMKIKEIIELQNKKLKKEQEQVEQLKKELIQLNND